MSIRTHDLNAAARARRTTVLLAALTLVSMVATAQLPPLIDLSVEPGSEASPVLRVYGDDVEDALGGDVLSGLPGAVAFGDFDGDGFTDTLVGAPSADPLGRATAGEAYIVFGTPQLRGAQVNLDTDGAIGPAGETRILGAAADQVTGRAVAAGDVDGDGYDDAIVAAAGVGTNDPVAGDPGRVWIVYGAPALRGAEVDLADPLDVGAARTQIVGTLDATTAGALLGGYSPLTGRSVASGDVDADGLDDVIIGASTADTPDTFNVGKVFVVYGSGSLRGTALTVGGAVAANVTEILGDDGGAVASQKGDSTGSTVAVGDVNADGFGDVIMGAPGADPAGGNEAGEVYIVYGASTLPGTTVDLNTDGTISDANETRIAGDDGVVPTNSVGDNAGSSVAAGDVNGDGFDDVIVGAPGASPLGRERAGEAYVIYGRAGLPGTFVNLNTNGPISGAGESRLLGPAAASQTGFSVGAGDVDGDGRSDIVIGARSASVPGSTQAGWVYAVYGVSIPAATNVDLATFTGKVEVHGRKAADLFGSSSAAGGDLDRDGFGDFAGTAPTGDNPLSAEGGADNNMGYAAVVFGQGASATATAVERFRAGDAAAKGMGGRLSPGARTWIGFTGGDAASWATATLTRNDAAVSALADTAVDVADVLWRVTTDRAGWTGAKLLFRYTDSEVAGLDESSLALYRADSPAGPWELAQNQSIDTARNEATADETQLGYFALAADSTAPALGISAPSATVTKSGPVSYTVTYSRATEITLSAGDIAINKAGTVDAEVAVSETGPSTRTVTLSNITGNGTLGISIAAGTARDASGNLAPAAGPSTAFRVDNTAPTVTLSVSSQGVTRSGPVSFDIVYAGADTVELALAQVEVIQTGTVQATVELTSPPGALVQTVTFSNITGDGTYAISIPAGTAYDAAGNVAPAAGPSLPFTVDNTPPGIVIGAPSPALTTSGPVTFLVTYSDADFLALGTGDIHVETTGTVPAPNVAVTVAAGQRRNVVLSNITGDGTLRISIDAGTAEDTIGNVAAAAGPSQAAEVDNTPPTVTIGAPSAATTQGTPVSFTVAYGGASSVSLAPENVLLAATGTATGRVEVSGDGLAERTVTIVDIAGEGTLGISLAAGTASDAVGNTALGAGPSGTVTADTVAPGVSIGTPSASLTADGPVSFPIVYTGASSVSLNPGQVELIATGTATGTVTVEGTGAEARTVLISNITGDGTLAIALPADTARDAAGNPTPAAGPSDTVTVDNAPPSLSIGEPSAAHTVGAPVTYLVTYSGADSVSLTAADVTVHATGTATGTPTVVDNGDGLWTVTVGDIGGDGTLNISIAAGTARDEAGNAAPGAGPSAAFAVGNVTLAVSVGPPSASATRGGPVTYSITYTGADTVTLALADISVVSTGTASGEVLSVGSDGEFSRIVTIGNIAGDGTLAIQLAAGTAQNTGGDSAPAVGPSAAFVVDNTGPALTIGAPSVAETTVGPVSFPLTYTGAASYTLSQASVSLLATGSATGTLSVTGLGTATPVVVVSDISGAGTLAISVAADTARDALGNPAPAAGPSGTVTVVEGPGVYPDINNDGRTDAADVQLVINGVLGRPVSGNADVNRDNQKNALDVQLVINAVLRRL